LKITLNGRSGESPLWKSTMARNTSHPLSSFVNPTRTKRPVLVSHSDIVIGTILLRGRTQHSGRSAFRVGTERAVANPLARMKVRSVSSSVPFCISLSVWRQRSLSIR
jgi:hypothetical protein